MRTQTVFRSTRSFVQKRPLQHASISYSRLCRYPRKEPTRFTSRTQKRASSSVIPPPSSSQEEDSSAGAAVEPPPPEDSEPGDDADKSSESEKPKRRKAKSAETDKEPPSLLPSDLNVVWSPSPTNPTSSPSYLPPPVIFQEALNDLLITLHPQTQHRAVYPSSVAPPVEPTLALYCPIEGGDYIIDETVRELAGRTGADVIVLDSVQLAAGEWGMFQKAGSALQFPRNPLHFPSTPQSSSSGTGPAVEEEEDTDGTDFAPNTVALTPMTFHVMASGSPVNVRAARQSVLSPISRGTPPSKIKSFFDELVNLPTVQEPGSVPVQPHRPRLIYIRDYPTLADSAHIWYPPLLSAVRQRRQGPISRPTSPVTNSMTIVFGITPSIVAPSNVSNSGMGSQSVMGLLTSRQSTSTFPTLPYRQGKNEYSEDDYSDRARERRLRERLRKWERNDPSLYDELPKLPSFSDDNSAGSSSRPRVVVIGPAGPSNFPSRLASMFPGRDGRSDDPEDNSEHFYRWSLLIPASRSIPLERACRMSRRKEINELAMRMAVGSMGGKLDELEPQTTEANIAKEESEEDDAETDDTTKMWDEWGRRVESWATMKEIANRAVGTVISAASNVGASVKQTLDPTAVPWSAVISAWEAQKSSPDVRKLWIQESTGKMTKEQQEDAGESRRSDEPEIQQDEVIQQIKQDPDLTPHEQRLLGCIVDAASMPTSFDQVHLPPHTIDSVRTIVSLPLLHPSAFQQGILKQHSMTGCLLFGPPGTGKTLVVRALAKEAGCRMLAVSPSDVMDMYVGEGEKLVKSVFSLARRLSPCVIFLDEIDALFGARMSARETGGAIAHRGVITEFMQEMDGLRTNKDSNVIVIGATNRPFDLDDAVLRRLPRRLLVDLPGEKEREQILKILLRDENLSDEVELQSLAKRTDLFSGSDLKHLCVSAALDAVKEKVIVPWEVPRAIPLPSSTTSAVEEHLTPVDNDSPSSSSTEEASATFPPEPHQRLLYLRNFNKALKEISPSSSESLGTLSALRKWNEEFGEGQTKKKRVMWGKGLFGFAEVSGGTVPDGTVASNDSSAGAAGEKLDMNNHDNQRDR